MRREVIALIFMASQILAGAVQAQIKITGGKTTVETVEDWLVECKTKDAGEHCQAIQRVMTQDASTVAMVMAMAWDSEAEAFRTQIIMPLGVDLNVPPLLTIDGESKAPLAWTRCLSTGCMFEGTLNKALSDRLIKGETATLTFIVPVQGPTSVPLSLKGFAAAIEMISP